MFRYLYDYTYECDIQESYSFGFFYYILEFYIALYVFLGGNFSIIYEHGYNFAQLRLTFLEFILLPTPVPLILNIILIIFIMKKKKIKIENRSPFAIFLAILLLLFSYILPIGLGLIFGLIPPAFIMQGDDNSLEKKIKAMEKENSEQKNKVKELLFAEQLAKRELKKSKQLKQNEEE